MKFSNKLSKLSALWRRYARGFICDGVRTPIGRYGGSRFKQVHRQLQDTEVMSAGAGRVGCGVCRLDHARERGRFGIVGRGCSRIGGDPIIL